jgi:sec-independent protein translocase protein TatA
MQGIEWIILLVAIIFIFVVGGAKLPELARSLGRAKGEFERGKMDIERELKEEKAKDVKKEEDAKQTKKEEKDIIKAAKELGIETEGKSEEELKEEIAKAVK